MKDSRFWIGLVIITVAVLLLVNINMWQVEDDEGTDLYSIWRFAEGEQPYVDFASTKAPLYLFVGKTAVELLGRNLLLLRLLSAVSIAASMGALAWAVKSVWGKYPALLLWSLSLLTPEVYHLARLFRTDSLMLPLVLLALALLVADVKRPRRYLLAGAGILFGLALMAKVVAVMPLLGALIWLGIRTLQERRWRSGILDVMALGLAAALVSVFGYMLVERWAPGAIAFVLGSPGDYDSSLSYRILKGFVGWLVFILNNPLMLFALPMIFIVGRRWRTAGANLFWLAQVMGCLPFFLISGPTYPRYLAYVVPGLVMLLITGMIILQVRAPDIHPAAIAGAALVLPLLMAYPSRDLLLRQETDTRELAAWVAAHTEPDDAVLSDYAELNFHAGRRSIYSQAVISFNWATTGLVTGGMLAEQIESEDVVMVLLHVPGEEGGEAAHLHHLKDYGTFYAYLERHFNRVQQWDRAGQAIEIWQRR